MKDLFKKKTTWTAIVLLLTAIADQFGIDIKPSVYAAIAAIGAIFMRSAIAKAEPTNDKKEPG